MRNTEERVLAVKQRAKELERHRRIRKVRISYVAASLLFIIGLSFAMPGIMTVMPDNEYDFSGAAAGIFGQKGGIAYVLIGLLAFLLGVGVTILSYRLSLKNRLEGMDSKDGDG